MPPELRSQSYVDSGYRTGAQQADIYARSKGGTQFAAAAPGHSLHERGLAADWEFKSPAADQWVHQNAQRYGLEFPFVSSGAGAGGRLSDPNHMQLAGGGSVQLAKNELSQSIPQPLHQQGAVGASNTFRQLGGSPLMYVNRFDDPSKLAQVISQANPNATDDAKMAIFEKLFPLLSNAGKAQFAQAWDIYKEGVRESEFATSKDIQQREFGIRQEELQQNRLVMQDVARQRLAQGEQRVAQGAERVAQAGQRLSEQYDPATVDAVAKGIAEYRQAPLSGWTMRSPWGQQVMARVYQDNPDYSAAQFSAGVSGARAFATGRQADTVRSMSVAIDHLQVAEDLGKALATGDSRALNTAKAALQKQFGYEGPVDFDTAKMIVGDEVTKAIAGGTLSMTERTALQQQFSTASSPEQLQGTIGTLKRLLGGQLRGLQRQYENIPGTKPSFEDKLSPEAKRQLQAPGGEAPEVTLQEYQQLPIGAPYRMPGDPTVRYKSEAAQQAIQPSEGVAPPIR
jgi:hypothetical protein